MSSRTDSGVGPAREESIDRSFGIRGERGGGTELSVSEPSRNDVFRTVFGLGAADVRTHDAVAEVPGSTTRELADHLDRDRSNVNRSLNRLREAGLVTRVRRLLDSGGHVYQYSLVSDRTAEDVVARAVDRWQSAAIDVVASE